MQLVNTDAPGGAVTAGGASTGRGTRKRRTSINVQLSEKKPTNGSRADQRVSAS
jgi:hypothetical protein